MKITIIPSDKKVGIDGLFFQFDLSSCNIPANVHALQWYETEGEIEFIDNPDRTKPQNEIIFELPVWANACVTIWNSIKAEQDAIAEAQRIAKEQALLNSVATEGTQTL